MKWEYLIVKTKNAKWLSANSLTVQPIDKLQDQSIEEAFNILGEDGWELVSQGFPMNKPATTWFFTFKRPKE